jgi:hypothetical protein
MKICKFCMFYNVHYSITVKENQQNAQIIYIFSIYCTYISWSLLIVTEYSNSTISAFVLDTIIYNCVIQIQTIMLYIRN